MRTNVRVQMASWVPGPPRFVVGRDMTDPSRDVAWRRTCAKSIVRRAVEWVEGIAGTSRTYYQTAVTTMAAATRIAETGNGHNVGLAEDVRRPENRIVGAE